MVVVDDDDTTSSESDGEAHSQQPESNAADGNDDAPLKPLTLPGYCEFWARLAYEVMRRQELRDAAAREEYHEAVRSAALSAAAQRFRPVDGGASGSVGGTPRTTTTTTSSAGGEDASVSTSDVPPPPAATRVQGLGVNLRNLLRRAVATSNGMRNPPQQQQQQLGGMPVGHVGDSAADKSGTTRQEPLSLRATLAFGLHAATISGVAAPDAADVAGWSKEFGGTDAPEDMDVWSDTRIAQVWWWCLTARVFVLSPLPSPPPPPPPPLNSPA